VDWNLLKNLTLTLGYKKIHGSFINKNAVAEIHQCAVGYIEAPYCIINPLEEGGTNRP
jgi:hypothetical protein